MRRLHTRHRTRDHVLWSLHHAETSSTFAPGGSNTSNNSQKHGRHVVTCMPPRASTTVLLLSSLPPARTAVITDTKHTPPWTALRWRTRSCTHRRRRWKCTCSAHRRCVSKLSVTSKNCRQVRHPLLPPPHFCARLSDCPTSPCSLPQMLPLRCVTALSRRCSASAVALPACAQPCAWRWQACQHTRRRSSGVTLTAHWAR